MQRQILNLEVRIITVVFIAGAAFAAVCGFSLLGPGRFLDGLWSVKAGSEHQFRTMGSVRPPVFARAGHRPDRRRDRTVPAPRPGTMGNHRFADGEPRCRHPDFVHGDLAVLPFVILIAAPIAGLCLPTGRGYFSRWGHVRPTASGS